jgi:hypothetical protein
MSAYLIFDVEDGPSYRSLKATRDECSAARLVSVEGLE